MTQAMQITNKTVVVVSQPESELKFSEEFLSMVHNRAYETLRAYLEKSKQAGAVELLDDMVILSARHTGSADQLVKNMILSEGICQASQHVLALGGSWGE